MSFQYHAVVLLMNFLWMPLISKVPSTMTAARSWVKATGSLAWVVKELSSFLVVCDYDAR